MSAGLSREEGVRIQLWAGPLQPVLGVAVVRVDERGRMAIPEWFEVRATRAVVIPAGSFLVVIPLSGALHEKAGGWLTSARSRAELKRAAEEAARRDAAERARRHGQL